MLNANQGNDTWGSIRKIPGLPEQIYFIWQTWWERMPTNVNLSCILEGKPSHCPFCPNCVEDMEHITRLCLCATEVWAKTKVPNSSNVPFKDWVKSNCINKIFSQILWSLLMSRSSSPYGIFGSGVMLGYSIRKTCLSISSLNSR